MSLGYDKYLKSDQTELTKCAQWFELERDGERETETLSEREN